MKNNIAISDMILIESELTVKWNDEKETEYKSIKIISDRDTTIEITTNKWISTGEK